LTSMLMSMDDESFTLPIEEGRRRGRGRQEKGRGGRRKTRERKTREKEGDLPHNPTLAPELVESFGNVDVRDHVDGR
jgi:hypothetical protein